MSDHARNAAIEGRAYERTVDLYEAAGELDVDLREALVLAYLRGGQDIAKDFKAQWDEEMLW